ncbi:MAG: endopeptidase La [Paludibacteraceae bacterium]|nr:endopeptidase La [Paludibacteraceae bacterium]
MTDNYSIALDLTLDNEDNNEQKNILNDIFHEDSDEQKDPTLQSGDTLDVLPIRGQVLFPGVLLPITVSREKSKKLVRSIKKQQKYIAVNCQLDRDIQEPSTNDLYPLGTAALILEVLDLPNGNVLVILEGKERIYAESFETVRGVIRAQITVLEETFPKRGDKEFFALASSIKAQAQNILESAENVPPEASMTLRSIDNPPTLINYICVNFGLKIEDKQDLLNYESLLDRAKHLQFLLNREAGMLKMKDEIQAKTKEEIDKQQREYYLNRQMEAIQKELGDTTAEVVKDLQNRAQNKNWPEKIAQVFADELKKLQRMSSHSPDYTTQQNYLETLLALPWLDMTEDNFDIKHAQEVLDRDHYGMEKVKERIIEYLAVQRQLTLRSDEEKRENPVHSPILCLYGPPGVGKTSLGRSISEALGRKYARISLGGLHDESEIRGHRRTYVGALPGRIIENIRKVKSSNPVFVLDEVDKIGADYKGDPTSALLEVLDPEQNSTFHDNYLDVDYDLSNVLFIATANTLDTIPRPLLDRMELIEMTGYLQEEKEEIAKRHLIPKELRDHGIRPSQLKFTKDILGRIIRDYTRESGVRSLDRQIAAICRKVDTQLALEKPYNTTITPEDLITYLGQPRFTAETYETNKYIGVVTGLAWTQVGGEILFIETSLSPAKTPTLTMTGNLGDVMKESATIALGYIKAHADQFGIRPKDIETHAVHIHVPEGAIPKDGPSAGITMTTALVSAFTKRKVRARIAMTGEMTLRGKVLPIGGVKEKILAAKRAGITDLILCEDNRKDITAIPEKYLKGLKFHFVRDIQEVIDFALLKK